jgi:hypothetical protein
MRTGLASALATAAVLTSGCVVASPDSDTYGDAAASTLGTAASEVATIETMLRLLDEGKISRPVVVTQLRYSEKSLGRATQSLGSLNPPRDRDTLAQQAGQLLDEAAGHVQDARVAIHRGRTGDYTELADDLDGLARELQDLETSAS